jgi:hypothetical protein
MPPPDSPEAERLRIAVADALMEDTLDNETASAAVLGTLLRYVTTTAQPWSLAEAQFHLGQMLVSLRWRQEP